MPINAHPEFFKAEEEYLNAKTVEDKIFFLEDMIKKAPKHKSSENLLSELKTRLKKLKEKAEKNAKKSTGGKKGIKKEGYQFVIIGFPNSGKSSLLAKLTNARPLITDHPYSTFQPEVGTFEFEGIKAQMIDQPSLGSDRFDIGLVNNADCLIFVIQNFEEISKIEEKIPRARGKKIIVFGKADILDENQKRKVLANMKSKRINGILISTFTEENLTQLKQLLIAQTDLIRIYMKEPNKPPSPIPMVLETNSTVKDVAEHILKGFSARVRETKVTGPSSKFPNQKVGLSHVLKDRDIIEFHTK